MKRIATLLALAFLAGPALADDAPPSEESVRALLKSMHAESVVQGTAAQVDALMKQGIDKELASATPTDEQRAIIEDGRKQMVAVIQDMLSWDNYAPVIIDIYRKSFTQSEIDGLRAFFDSPPGQAYVNKLPVVTQNSLQAVMAMVQPMVGKIQAIGQEMERKLSATRRAADKASEAAEAAGHGAAAQPADTPKKAPSTTR